MSKKTYKEYFSAFSQEEVQMAKTHEEMFNILAIEEMQIKITLRFYFSHVGMATRKNINNKW
jgi:hypothetical protein